MGEQRGKATVTSLGLGGDRIIKTYIWVGWTSALIGLSFLHELRAHRFRIRIGVGTGIMGVE